MKYYLKLNVVSILYAVMVVVPIELMVNVYRISRVTNWEINTVITVLSLTIIGVVIAGTVLLSFLTKKWMGVRKGNYWTVILWVPYFILFAYLFANAFPITYEGDVPNPAIGLLIIGGLLAYPFYILVINYLSSPRGDKTVKAA
ncbi:hypothetical protein [Oceanobacillus kapialis]|uniref:Uncharacterized protein n=1 Tax=Oceanobacillus kapialis TaxID=481353 RepID=A0ABW5Q2V9_9BACI